MSARTFFLLVWIGACIGPGCSSLQQAFREGLPQEVTILSYPEGARVSIGGESKGITPLTVELGRKVPHKVVLEKEGYQTAVQYFVPSPNEREAHFVKFGLLVDTGWYRDLTPEAIAAVLDHRLVPKVRSPKPFQDISRRILEADQLLAQGDLEPLEHRLLTEKIVTFYGL